jgi:hypothetical protein
MIVAVEFHEMTKTEFQKYWNILKREPFCIYPKPIGPDQNKNWGLVKFTVLSLSETHVVVVEAEGETAFELPLAVVEFANTGVLRVSRQLYIVNGTFV